MKKIYAEILAGLIPDKMARNRWRGILRFGVRNALKLKRDLRKPHPAPEVYLAVCVIAKDEGQYFKEWLDWHINQGVDKFYVYDNGSTDNTSEVLRPYVEKGIVEHIPYPGYRMQLAAYDDCMSRHRYDTRWIAFIDMDEFVVPVKDKTLREYLKKMEKHPVVEINWLVYGSGGARNKEEGPVMMRFKKHSLSEHPVNNHVKSIVDPRRVYGMIGCHEAARINGKAADSHGNPVKTAWRNRTAQHDVIRINHYAVKSYEEFIEKKGKGRASGPVRDMDEEYFRVFDLNDLEDD